MKKGRLLIFTDNSYVSAFLFHGLGHPPWKDIPELQQDPSFRNRMTETVNVYIQKAKENGFKRFDVHEAFPVNLMTISEDAEIIRGIDRILPERKYKAAVLLKEKFPQLSKQPRWKMLREISAGGQVIDEDMIIAECLRSANIKLLEGFHEPPELRYPLELKISFQGKADLAYAHLYPGVKEKKQNSFTATAENPEQLMGFYKYAGICIPAVYNQQ